MQLTKTRTGNIVQALSRDKLQILSAPLSCLRDPQYREMTLEYHPGRLNLARSLARIAKVADPLALVSQFLS